MGSSEEVAGRLEDLICLTETSNKVVVSWLAALKKIVNLQSLGKGEN